MGNIVRAQVDKRCKQEAASGIQGLVKLTQCRAGCVLWAIAIFSSNIFNIPQQASKQAIFSSNILHQTSKQGSNIIQQASGAQGVKSSRVEYLLLYQMQ